MKYTIQPGIAALQRITPEGEPPYSAVYLGPELLDPNDKTIYKVEYSLSTPPEVKAVVNRNFGMLFSVPVGRRQSIIDNMVPVTVEVTD